MRAAATEALADGAWGMSTGLVYPPGAYANTDEIVAVGAGLPAVDGLYASHIRNENDDLIPAIEEAIEIGRRLGVRVEVSHLKSAGVRNHGRAAEALAVLAAARAEGLPIHHDAYPYAAGSTFLTMLLPPWVHDGGNDALVERLGSERGPCPHRRRRRERSARLAELHRRHRRLGRDHDRGRASIRRCDRSKA